MAKNTISNCPVPLLRSPDIDLTIIAHSKFVNLNGYVGYAVSQIFIGTKMNVGFVVLGGRRSVSNFYGSVNII